MDAHSIGSRPSATTDTTATNHLNDRPASGPSRRTLLAGLAVLPLAACPAPAPARPAGVCAKLAELIDVANDARAASDAHYETHLKPFAKVSPAERSRLVAHATRLRSNDLGDESAWAEIAVCQFVANSPADFHAKIVFMIERDIFSGMDWSAEMLADATRLAGKEA